MNQQLILERAFLFEAHNEKAFHKLRDNQFARLTQGLIHEPFANALDQQAEDQPVRVEVTPAATPVEAIDQALYPVAEAQKTDLLVRLLEEEFMTRMWDVADV